MPGGYALDHCEAEANACGGAGVCTVHAIEALEYTREVLRCDPTAGILHGDGESIAGLVGGDRNGAARSRPRARYE